MNVESEIFQEVVQEKEGKRRQNIQEASALTKSELEKIEILNMDWPAPSELLDALLCVVCKGTPTHRFFCCQEGHMICESDALYFKTCPGMDEDADGRGDPGAKPGPIRCGKSIGYFKLRWFKWMTEKATYQCPIEGCRELFRGEMDKEGHVQQSHPGMIMVKGRVVMKGHKSLDDLVQVDVAANAEREENPTQEHPLLKTSKASANSKRSDTKKGDEGKKVMRDVEVMTEKIEVKSVATETEPEPTSDVAGASASGGQLQDVGDTSKKDAKKSGWVADDGYDDYEVGALSRTREDPNREANLTRVREDYKRFLKATHAYNDNEEEDDDDYWGVKSHVPSTEPPREKDWWKEFSPTSSPRNYGFGVNSNLLKVFRLEDIDVRLYESCKAKIDKGPEQWIERFRRGRTRIPDEAILRELNIIKDRYAQGKKYRMYAASPPGEQMGYFN